MDNLERIKKILKRDWYIQGFNAVPVFLNTSAISGFKMQEKLGFSYSAFIFNYQNGYGEMGYLNSDFKKLWQIIKKKIKSDPNYLKNVKNQYDKIFAGHKKTFSQIEELNLSNLSEEKLFQLFKKCARAQTDSVGLAHIVDAISIEGEKEVKKILANKIKNKTEYNRNLTIFTFPCNQSFLAQEEKGLNNILSSPIQNQKTLLKKHQEKYFWILNGYWGAKVLDEKYFLSELCNLISNSNPTQILQKIKQAKEKLNKEKIEALKKYLPSKEIIKLGRVTGQSTAWQDERKAINLIGNYYLDLFLQEFSRRLKIDKNDLKYFTPPEIIELFNGKKTLVKKISSRKKMGALEFDEKNVRFVEGKEAKEILNKLNRGNIPEGEIKEIKGLVVSVGEKIIQGKVRILKNASEAGKLKSDEILVTVMTSPEYIQAIKQAKAIITDEGGLTCHAAIVSRELGKTCLVSTKIATKILKDGDLVKIDGERGIIKLINEIENRD